MRRLPAMLPLGACALACCWPALARACAVCGEGSGRNHAAFFNSTIFLSVLPLAMLAGGLFWLARNARGFLASEFRESDELPMAGPPGLEAPVAGDGLGPLPAADGARS